VVRDRWCAAFLALLALAYLLVARRYPVDTLATPGPGVMPVLAGFALLGIAIALFATSRRVGAARDATRAAGVPALDIKPLILCAALVVYAVALPRVGFVVSSFALVVVASRLMGETSWWRPVALAVGVVTVSQLLFARWLGVPLP
jgi:putative tricarboxylic transport membrane protein